MKKKKEEVQLRAKIVEEKEKELYDAKIGKDEVEFEINDIKRDLAGIKL